MKKMVVFNYMLGLLIISCGSPQEEQVTSNGNHEAMNLVSNNAEDEGRGSPVESNNQPNDKASFPVNNLLNYSLLLIEDVKFYNDSSIANYIISDFLQESDMKESLDKIENTEGLFPNKDIAKSIVKDLIEIPDVKLIKLVDAIPDKKIINKENVKNLKGEFKTTAFSFPVISGNESSAILVMKQKYKSEEHQWLLLFVKKDNKWAINYVLGSDNKDGISYEIIQEK